MDQIELKSEEGPLSQRDEFLPMKSIRKSLQSKVEAEQAKSQGLLKR